MSIRRFCVALLLLGSVLASGCVSYEGVGFSKVSYINPGMQKFAKLDGETDYGDNEKEAAQRTDLTEVIAIGTVTVFREFDGDDYEKAFARYVKNFEDWGVSRGPSVSFEEFKDRYAGWTRIRVLHIPLLVGQYMAVLVHRSVVGEVEFEGGSARL